MPHPNHKRTEAERFWMKVERLPNGCWRWAGTCSGGGYGSFHLTMNGGKSRTRSAHRYSYELNVGPIPEGLTLDHLCRNKWCVNPVHLEPVTSQVNTLRSDNPPARNARKSHCPKGHPFDEANTYSRRGGGRTCKQCNRANCERRERKLLLAGYARVGHSRKWTLRSPILQEGADAQ